MRNNMQSSYDQHQKGWTPYDNIIIIIIITEEEASPRFCETVVSQADANNSVLKSIYCARTCSPQFTHLPLLRLLLLLLLLF